MSTSSVRAGEAYIELTTKSDKLVKGLQSAQKKLKAFGSSLTGIGSKMTAISGLAAAPFVMMTKTFADFDDQMLLSQGITNATDAELSTLTETAEELGFETSYTATQVANGMVALSRMGFTVDEVNKSIGNMINLDLATGMNDLGASADIAANAMRSFGLSASDSKRISDVLTATANGSAQTLTDVGEALKMAAPNAHMANATLEDTCAMLGVLANMGIKGSMAGSAVAKSFEKLASGKGLSILEGKGIQAKDANGNLRNMRDILLDIGKVTKKMGSAEKIDFLTKIFDVRGVKGGGVISNNIKNLDDMIKKIFQSGGVAEATAKKMDSGIGGSFRKFASRLDGVKREIGKIIAKAIKPYVDMISGILKIIAKWVKSHQDVVISILKVIAIVGAAGIALIALGTAVKMLAFAFGGLAIVLKVVTFAVLLPIKAFGMLVSVIGVLKAALIGLKAVLIGVKVASLATWAAALAPVVGLTALAVLVWQLFGGLEMLKNALKGLGSSFTSAFATIGAVAKESFGAIKTAFAAGDLAGAAKIGLAALKVAWLAGIMPLKKAWYDFKLFLADSWTGVCGEVMKLANSLWYGLLIGLKSIGNGIAIAWDAIWNGVIGAFESTIGHLKKKWIQFKGFFDKDVDVEAEIKKVDDEIAANKSERARMTNDAVNRRNEEVRKLEQERDKANADVDEKTASGMRSNRADYEKSMAEAADGLKKAKDDWQSAIDEVKKKAQQKELAPKLAQPEKIQKIQEKISTGTAEAAGKMKTTNASFDARVLTSLFRKDGTTAQTAQERTANAAEETAKNTKQLAQKNSLLLA